MGQGRDRHPPALVDLAHHVGGGHADVLEEDLVELGLARDLAEGPDGDTGGLHVHEDEGDALVLGGAGIRPHEEEAPVGHMRHARPHLLTVEHVRVAVEDGARLEIGEVAARVGLREALAPELVGVQDLAEMPGLLRRRAVAHQGGTEHGDAAAIHGLGRLRAGHLFVEDDLLHDRGAAPAVLRRPVDADVARLVEDTLPFAQPVDLPAVGPRRGEGPAFEVGGDVLGEPGSGLRAKALLLGGEIKIH